MIVLLPAPLGPSKPKTSPWFTEKLTESTAVWSPKLLTRSTTSIIGEDCAIVLLLLSSNSCHYSGKRLTRSLQETLKPMLQHLLLIGLESDEPLLYNLTAPSVPCLHMFVPL